MVVNTVVVVVHLLVLLGDVSCFTFVFWTEEGLVLMVSFVSIKVAYDAVLEGCVS